MDSIFEDFLDPQLVSHANGVVANGHGDFFGEDIKPKVESEQLKVEIPAQDEEMEDLFGDDEEKEEKDEDAEREHQQERSASLAASAPRDGSEALSASELRHRKELEYEEDEGQEENVVELKHAVLSIPNIPMPKSSDGNNWVIKMPNFVKLDPKPFHPETYVGPEQSTDGIGEKEKSLSIKLEVENTIRWKWVKDDSGRDKRQSNSRVIRWSDGSLSLLLGKELFDISQAYEGVSGIPRQTSSLGSLSQSQSQSQNVASQALGRGSGLTYLVAQHKRPGILQTEAPITGHMTLRPTGMQSETHRKLARAVGQKHSRVARLRIAPDSIIEQEQQELMKAAQKKPRRARASTAGDNDDLGGPARKRRSSYGRRRESVWSDEEPEAGASDTDEEDEGEYDSSPRKSRRSSGDNSKGADDKRGGGDYQTDDFLVADSSEGEEDSDANGKRRSKNKKRRRRSAEEDAGGEVDALDELDAKIARQEEESRRKKRTAELDESTERDAHQADGKGAEEVPMDMDVESEEEGEEEFNIRRTGAGSRKKRAIAMDEDEDE